MSISNETLTIDKFKEAANMLSPFDVPSLSYLMTGYEIYETPHLMTKVESFTTVNRTFRERWVLPILHPATVPFEPWVKTKIISVYKLVPSKSILRIDKGLLMHPETRRAFDVMLKTLQS